MLYSFLRRSLRFLYFKLCLTYKAKPTVRLGSEYGGWNVPTDFLTPNSICYLAGAGLDISFDLEIAAQFKSQVHIFDPTPRAYDHYLDLTEHVKQSISMPYKEGRYCINSIDFENITFHKIGIWNNNETLKFYAPQNIEHISHSAVNLQKTESYFEAEVKSISSIMNELGHSQIDLLKLDIEGAEYNVLDNLIATNKLPTVLCVEFDEVHTPLNLGFIYRIHSQIKRLRKSGYYIINIDNAYNITFMQSLK